MHMNCKIKKEFFFVPSSFLYGKHRQSRLPFMFYCNVAGQIQIRLMAVILVSILSAGLFTLVTGCGKKAPPLPPLKYILPPPAALTYNLSNDRIILKWTYDHKKSEQAKCRGFKIFRALRDLSGKGCMGCPLQFRKLTSVSSNQLNYTEKIKKGFQYYYKIRAYSENNVLSDFSNTIEVKNP